MYAYLYEYVARPTVDRLNPDPHPPKNNRPAGSASTCCSSTPRTAPSSGSSWGGRCSSRCATRRLVGREGCMCVCMDGLWAIMDCLMDCFI